MVKALFCDKELYHVFVLLNIYVCKTSGKRDTN